MKRPARLQSAVSWLKQYSGKNVLRGYCKHYGVDWRCAAIELKQLGVHLDPDYLKRREITEQQLANSRKRRREARTEEASPNVGMSTTLLWKHTSPRTTPHCMPWNANATHREAMDTRNEQRAFKTLFSFPVNSDETSIWSDDGQDQEAVRRKAVPKRKQVKQQAPTIEGYVRKLPKERLVEIVLKEVRSDESLERELLDEILERFGKPSDFIEARSPTLRRAMTSHDPASSETLRVGVKDDFVLNAEAGSRFSMRNNCGHARHSSTGANVPTSG